jgi:hypothetical protein
VGAEELEIAKSYLVGSFPLGFERAARRASYLISHELHGFPPDNLERLLGAFAAVSSADVQRVARAHLHPEASCLAAAGPVAKKDARARVAQQDALESAMEAKLSPQAIIDTLVAYQRSAALATAIELDVFSRMRGRRRRRTTPARACRR